MSDPGLEPTERQRKLIDVLRSQLSLGHAELAEFARIHADVDTSSLTRRTASRLITELHRRKAELIERTWMS